MMRPRRRPRASTAIPTPPPASTEAAAPQTSVPLIRRLHDRPAARSDEDLYAGLLRGDEDVFDELYREAFPKARRALLNRSCPEPEAEDLFQEALVALWQNARAGKYQLRPGTRVSTYLTQLCINRWIDRTRLVAYRRTDTRDELPERGGRAADAAEEHAAEERAATEAYFARLEAGLAQLGEACQHLLRRFYLERASLSAIAEERGISAASAKTEKYRCMQRLKRNCAE